MKYLISCQLYFVFINKKLTNVLHNAYAIMPVGTIKLFMPQSYPQCTAPYVLSEHSAQTKARKKAYIQLI